MRSKFIICNVEFTFKIIGISGVFRMNPYKLDKLIDFDNRSVIKLSKSKGHLRLCTISSSIRKIDIIPYLKANYEFMNQVIECMNIISRIYKPRSIDYSEITGEEVIVNEFPLSDKDIVIRWNNSDMSNLDNKLLITIF